MSGGVILALVLICLLIAALGAALGLAARHFRVEGNPVIDQVDAILPQTQCAQCGYPGCRPYAEAIINDNVPINQCPPGGEAGIKALAELLDREPIPLNPDNGAVKPKAVAVIIEEDCIGCTKCIQDCPVDAIVGASKMMHTVIADECTGCELCIPPCPVDCIVMVEDETTTDSYQPPMPSLPAHRLKVRIRNHA